MKQLCNAFYKKLNEKLHDFKYQLLIADLVTLFMTWGGFYRGGLNWDSLQHQCDPPMSISAMYICGRYIGAAMSEYPYKWFGFNPVEHQHLAFMYFMPMIVIAAWMLQLMFLGRVQRQLASSWQKIGYFVITILPVINVFFSEYFYYAESVHMFGLGLIFCIGAAWLWINHRYGWSIFLSFLVSMLYQAWSVYTVMIIAVWLYLDAEGKLSWKLFWKEFWGMVWPLGLSALNIVSITVFANLGIFRAVEKEISLNFLDRIYDVWIWIPGLFWNNWGLMPVPYLPLVLTVVPFFLLLIHFVREKRWNEVGTAIVLFMVMAFLTLLIPLSNPGAGMIPRIMTVFYCAQAVFNLTVFILIPGRVERKILTFFTSVYVLAQVFSIQQIIANRYLSNGYDREYAYEVMRRIELYEQETGIVVNKIATRADENSPHSYETVSFKAAQVNESTYRTGTRVLVNAMTRDNGWGRYWEYVEIPDTVWQQNFEGKDWDHFDPDEQIVFDGDTVCICIF